MTSSTSTTDSPQAPLAKPPDVLRKIHLTLPRQSVQYWSAELSVPLSRDVILHADAEGDGKATLLVGRVRVVR